MKIELFIYDEEEKISHLELTANSQILIHTIMLRFPGSGETISVDAFELLRAVLALQPPPQRPLDLTATWSRSP